MVQREVRDVQGGALAYSTSLSVSDSIVPGEFIGYRFMTNRRGRPIRLWGSTWIYLYKDGGHRGVWSINISNQSCSTWPFLYISTDTRCLHRSSNSNNKLRQFNEQCPTTPTPITPLGPRRWSRLIWMVMELRHIARDTRMELWSEGSSHQVVTQLITLNPLSLFSIDGKPSLPCSED
jgi:hypothetical protein